MKQTFRTRVFAVVTSGGAFRLHDSKKLALAHFKALEDLGLKPTLWRGKPTWRRQFV